MGLAHGRFQRGAGQATDFGSWVPLLAAQLLWRPGPPAPEVWAAGHGQHWGWGWPCVEGQGPSEQITEGQQRHQEQQEPGSGAARRAGPGTVVKVGPDAGSVSHHVGDVVLLVDAVQQVRHGALGKNRHVFPAVGLMAQGHS